MRGGLAVAGRGRLDVRSTPGGFACLGRLRGLVRLALGPERELEPREALAVRFAEKLAGDFHGIDDAFKAELSEHFSDAEIVELSVMIGQYLALGRMLVITGKHKAACEIYTTGD